MEKTNERWERFKAQVLEWKTAHNDEYLDFAIKMDTAGGAGFMEMALLMQKQSPELMMAWEKRWHDDTRDTMEELDRIVLKSDVLKTWIGEVEGSEASDIDNIDPLTLCWIIYGQMFETVIRQCESLRHSSKVGFIQKHVVLPMVIKKAIRTSIKNGYRTRHDWDLYFKLAKAYGEDAAVAEAVWESLKGELTVDRERTILEEANLALQANIVAGQSAGRNKAKFYPLSAYLTCENKDEVLDIIKRYIKQNNSSVPIALTYTALQELGIISGITVNTEYYHALTLQYSDLDGMKSKSSCLHALGDVQRTQKVYKDGRLCDGRLNEDDRYAPLYNTLVKKLKEAMENETKTEV